MKRLQGIFFVLCAWCTIHTLSAQPEQLYTANGEDKYAYNIKDRYLLVAEEDKPTEIQVAKEEIDSFVQTVIYGVSNVEEVEVKTFNGGKNYYLTGYAHYEQQRVLFAMELDKAYGKLVAHKMNLPWYLCRPSSCTNCAFTLAANGEINRCKCADDPSDPCKVRSGIKTTSF